jgi:hypothetical protein
MKLGRLTIGLVVAIAAFIVANIYSYIRMPASSTIDDGFVYFGWPFNIYAYGGYYGHPVYIWTGLLANVVIAAIVGLIIGLAFTKLTPR